jgi:hypothetical protein
MPVWLTFWTPKQTNKQFYHIMCFLGDFVHVKYSELKKIVIAKYFS